MNQKLSFKTILGSLLQIFGGAIAFLFSLIVANLIVPLSPEIIAAATTSGFLSTPLAFLFNSLVNSVIMVWAAKRTQYKGIKLAAMLFVLSFGIQVFETQIETGYFLSAFPLLHNNFQLYVLILRGLITSLLFALLIALITGGFSRLPRSQSAFTVTADNAIRYGSWLPAIYFILYLLFGYFVAWQVKDLRLFYNGPAELNSFFEQWSLTLMQKPELPVFQYMRGIIWILCLVPLFKGFTGKRAELIILSALALALLPTVQLSFANPLMPAAVSLGHFWEVAISTGIFGALCAWFVPEPTTKP